MKSLHNFQAYDLSLQLYRKCEAVPAKRYLKDQLSRASLSVVLNLAEGSAKPTAAEQKRFYAIALGSIRETQALLEILDRDPEDRVLADRVGAIIFRLVQPRQK